MVVFQIYSLLNLVMESKREAIVNLHRAGKSNAAISKSLCVARPTVWKAVKRFNEWGDFCDHQRSGRPRSQRHTSMIKAIQERVRRNPRRTIRKMAKDTEMSPRTMGRLIHEDLRMSSFTLQKRQSLSMTVKQKRLERSKLLLNELKRGTTGETVWSDEKILTVEQAHNCRNDDIPYAKKTVYRTMKPAFLMIWAAVVHWQDFDPYVEICKRSLWWCHRPHR